MKGNLKSLWRHVIPALAVSFALVPAAAEAQDQDERPIVVVQQPEGPPPFANLRGFSDDYRVGPGDLLDIQVVGQEQLRQSLRVSNSGEISFSMLGLVRVGELTPFEIEEALSRKLREKGYVHDAEVLVFVREYQAKPIYVQGAVVNPGEYVMSQDLTVTDAILLAGGLRLNAADQGMVQRRNARQTTGSEATASPSGSPPRPAFETIPIDLKPLKAGRFAQDAMPLKRGDVVVVPEQRMSPYYVVGEVLTPRNYFFAPERKLMASQAIAAAGGPLPWAKLSQGILIRYAADGTRSEVPVNWGAILKGEQPDFQVQMNDIIFIPGSRVKTIAHGLVQLTDTMAMQQSFRVGRRIQLPEREDAPTREQP